MLIACLQLATLQLPPPNTEPQAAAVSSEPEPLYASPTRLDRIGRVVAPVMINGRGPFRLVVDKDVYGATDTIAVGETSIVPPIKIGPAAIKGAEVVFGDFHIFHVWKR